MKKQIIKIIIVALIIIGIAQLIGYLEIQYSVNKFKQEGIGDYGSGLAFLIILVGSFYGIEKNLPKEWEEKDGCLTGFSCFIFSITLSFTMMFHVGDKLEETVAEALKDSYTTIGHITKKSKSSNRSNTYYHIWAGINDKSTSRYTVDKDRYDMSYVGAPVIMKVSKEYPSINEIIIWDPKPDDIDKYQNKDK